jgi:hypothetical protein
MLTALLRTSMLSMIFWNFLFLAFSFVSIAFSSALPSSLEAVFRFFLGGSAVHISSIIAMACSFYCCWSCSYGLVFCRAADVLGALK